MTNENEKLYYFIQMPQDFYITGDQALIEMRASEAQVNPNDILMFYTQLILSSLKNRGLIKSSFDTLTAKDLIALTHFRTGRGFIKDIEFVNTIAIPILEELGLCILRKNKIYMTRAKGLSKTKLEDSQRRAEDRKSREEEIEILLFCKKFNCSEEEAIKKIEESKQGKTSKDDSTDDDIMSREEILAMLDEIENENKKNKSKKPDPISPDELLKMAEDL